MGQRLGKGKVDSYDNQRHLVLEKQEAWVYGLLAHTSADKSKMFKPLPLQNCEVRNLRMLVLRHHDDDASHTSLGLISYYNNNADFALSVKMITVLDFVKIEDIN